MESVLTKISLEPGGSTPGCITGDPVSLFPDKKSAHSKKLGASSFDGPSSLHILQKKIGYTFSDISNLSVALTHPSAKARSAGNACYQRLEFLGDKVLGLIVANYLFVKNPTETEGEISRRHSRIVCGSSCVRVANSISLGDYIILSKSQEKDGGRKNPRILENTLEAVIGAVYIDGNLSHAKRFILTVFKDVLESESTGLAFKDAKTALQEWAQKHLKRLPAYETTERFVDSGNRFFESVVTISEGEHFTGLGKTIKVAEKNAAERAFACVSGKK